MRREDWIPWRALDGLDPRVRVLTLGQLVLSVGRGVLMPFATLYFYNVQHFPLALIGLAFAIALPAGAVVGLFWGALADRVGRKPLMILGFTGMACTTAGLAFVTRPSEYIGIVVLNAIAISAWNPAARAMVADVTDASRRTRAYGLLYLANNAGISLGLVLGGLVALALPYRALFFFEAAGAAAYLLVVMLLVAESRTPTPETPRVESAARKVGRHLASVATPLRDARFLVFGLATMLAGFGWCQLYITYSPFMANRLGFSDAWIGAMLAINTVLVVALQVPIARWAEARERTWVYLVANQLLAWSLLLTWLAGRAAGFGPQLGIVALAIAIQTLGEIMVVPVGSAMAAALAGGEEHFGKYMAAFDLTWTTSAGLGSVLGGWFFDVGQPMLLWPSVTAFVVLSLAGFWWLGRVLPRGLNRSAPDPRGYEAPA